MKLFYSTTSPYARIARIALAEKGLGAHERQLTDPWRDATGLLEANPSARVPALVLDEGRPLTESLLIVMWLEARHPKPSLLGGDPDGVISRAGIAMGAIDAAAAVIIGRKSDPAFGESPVGLRRRRSVINAMRRLESDPPTFDEDAPPTLAVITAVVALDYLRFRFAAADWMPPLPRLDALAARARKRPSFAETMPREMPAA